jgi:hypothetical protein
VHENTLYSIVLSNQSMLLFALEITVCDGQEVFSSAPRLTGLFFQRLVYGGVLPPPHSLRQAQGCGFPHTQVAKRTAPSRQSQPKRPLSRPHIAEYSMLSAVMDERHKNTPWFVEAKESFIGNLSRGLRGVLRNFSCKEYRCSMVRISCPAHLFR